MTLSFDVVSPCYDRFMRGLRLYHVDHVIRMLGSIDANGRIIDLAGGTGYYARALTDLFREVIVVDKSPHMLRFVPPHERIRTVQSDMRQTGLPGGSCDAILLSDALHHAQDQSAVMMEAMRLLRPGGRLLVHEFDPASFPVTLLGIFERLLFGSVHYLPPDNLEALCAMHGFQRLSVERRGWYYLYLGARQ